MKVRLIFKTPGIYDYMDFKCQENYQDTLNIRKQVKQLGRKWIEFGEYINIEIDTEIKTCVVIPLKEI